MAHMHHLLRQVNTLKHDEQTDGRELDLYMSSLMLVKKPDIFTLFHSFLGQTHKRRKGHTLQLEQTQPPVEEHHERGKI